MSDDIPIATVIGRMIVTFRPDAGQRCRFPTVSGYLTVATPNVSDRPCPAALARGEALEEGDEERAVGGGGVLGLDQALEL